MKITRKNNYTIIKAEKGNIADFVKYISKNHSDFKKDNVVIDIINYKNLSISELLLFLETSNLHRSQKKSFVIVNDSVESEAIPEELIVVPGLLEAGDIIGMEELERELGF